MVRTITAVTLIFVFLSAVPMRAETARELFGRAGTEYSAGNFQEALEIYQSVKEKGPGVWCNMGNCLYALKRYPHAIAAFQRAQRGAHSVLFETLNQNIQAAYTQLGKSNDQLITVAFFWRWAYLFSPFLLQLFFLLCWYACWFFVIKRRTYTFSGIILTVLLCMLMLVGSFLLVHYYDYLYKKGVVVEQVRLCAGPDAQYDVIEEVPLLEAVHIRDTQKGWHKVTTKNQSGWVPVESIEMV